MKILFVAMPSIHTRRWISQLKHSGFEVHWFDILNGGYINQLDWVTQHTNWRYPFGDFKGRTALKKYVPKVHRLLERNVQKEFERILNEVQPDVVHSLALKQSALPIIEIMSNYPHSKWVYSSWGSDMYNSKGKPNYAKDLKQVLTSIDCLMTDCHRDYQIAKTFDFKGSFLGVFPGGGGYALNEISKQRYPFNKRQVILIKGYQGRLGRSIEVLNSILSLEDMLSEFKIIVFGAHMETINFVKTSRLSEWPNFSIHEHFSHSKLIELMCQAKYYIGNNISDGMPNTLLEAVCSGAYPIQSNPGGATAEIITDGFNGSLIEKPDDVAYITQVIRKTLNKPTQDLEKGVAYNLTTLAPRLDREYITNNVVNTYNNL